MDNDLESKNRSKQLFEDLQQNYLQSHNAKSDTSKSLLSFRGILLEISGLRVIRHLFLYLDLAANRWLGYCHLSASTLRAESLEELNVIDLNL